MANRDFPSHLSAPHEPAPRTKGRAVEKRGKARPSEAASP